MKKNILGLAAIAGVTLAAQPVFAEDYQTEVGATYTNIDSSPSDSVIGVDATFYLDAVSTDGKPLAEAAFLGHKNNISANYYTYDKAKIDGFGVGAEFWLDELYLSADINRNKSGGVSNTGYEANIGYMLQDNFLAYAGLADSGVSGDKTEIHAGTKFVGEIAENQLFNLEGSAYLYDSDFGVRGAADYFIANNFSVGLHLDHYFVSGADTEIGFGTRYFFGEQLSLAADYTVNGAGDNDTITIGIQGRF